MRAGLRALARVLFPGPGEAGPDPYAQFERWAAEETRRGFHSTFFAVARPARAHEYDPLYALGDSIPFYDKPCTVGEMLQRLGRQGFEIGLHGSYESWRDTGALDAQKSAIAAAAGAEVRSTRQHFLRLDLDQTWEAQEKAGLETDATLGYNEAVGFRAGIAAPFHPWDATRSAGRGLLEVPLTLMDGALFRGLGLSPDAARQRTLQHLDAVEKAGGMAGLLWHPNVAAETLYPGWWRCFVAALDRLAGRGAWVASVGEIAAWWRERSARLMTRGA
jgi:peptidoglycan/xylan/chitin deacetylase (PgdA/CDA1 family)